MARGDIENIDALFSDALDAGADSLDAFGNPEAKASDLFDDEDSYVVLDENDAMGMFDTLDVVDIDDDEDDEEEAVVDLAAEPVVENRRAFRALSAEEPSETTSRSEARSAARTNRTEPARPHQRAEKADAEDGDDVEVPEWVVSLRSKLLSSVAHAFLLSGNIRDYMVRNITIKDGLVQVLDPELDKFDVIAEYDQAHGLSFYGEDEDGPGGKSMADVYRQRFMDQMHEAQDHLSMPRTDDIPNRDPVSLFTCMSYMFDHPSKTSAARILLFIDYSDFLVPDASAAQMKPEERKLAITLSDIGRSARADDAGNCLIFMTDDVTQLSTRIRSAESRIEHMKIPIPDLDERLDFIEHVLDVDENTLSDGTQVFDHPDSIDKNTFAINTAGLSRIQIEDIMLRCLCDDEPLTLRIMKDRKNDIIHEDYDDVLEIVDPKFGFERIGGLEHLKTLFKEEIIGPIHAGELEAVPMGLLLMGPPGTAKPLVNGTILHSLSKKDLSHIAVPIEQLQVGDIVLNRWGGPTRVTAVIDKGLQDVYELTFKDGRKIQCSEDHIWTVRKLSETFWHERTVREILEEGLYEPGGQSDKRLKFYIPMNRYVEYPEQDLPIDPYVVGSFLGDGCCTLKPLTFSSADEESVQEIARIIGAVPKKVKHGYSWTFAVADEDEKQAQKEWLVSDGGRHHVGKVDNFQTCYFFRDIPEMMVLTHEKKIPEQYKYGSVEQRIALIQGLFDTDGSFVVDSRQPKKGPVSINTVSKQLADDIREVLFSLGISNSLTLSDRTGEVHYVRGKKYVRNSVEYRINVNCDNDLKPYLFRLSRKVERAQAAADYIKRKNQEHVGIVSIEKLNEQKPMTCIAVDMPDGLFLGGKDYVVCHNTFLSKAVAHEAEMNFVALNLNRIMEKWVGSTERNLDRALDCAMAMAPTIIFIDEIDEALPNRADPNQTAVNKRVNQRLLTFFSDVSHRGQVMILAATNYPEKVDPAFKRAGRFDMRIPMFAPDEFDRMRIMLVIAEGRGYTFSWFEDPDTIVPNPFANLRNWLEAGNTPLNEKFVGDRAAWHYSTKSSLGSEIQHEIFLPKKLIAIIDEPNITLQQLYEGARILFEDMPQRAPDASTGEIETNEVFFGKIHTYLSNHTDIIGTHGANVEELYNRLVKWEMVYKPFCVQTFQMTGAELDVVMNKAITLWRRFLRRNPNAIDMLIERGNIQDEKDIPWIPFLLDACRKTVNAVAGIKLMEDNALLNTSDLDFIPDAMYAETDDGRQISYHERQEELVAGQTKAQLKKK